VTVIPLCGPCSPGSDGVRNCGNCGNCDCLDDAHGPVELSSRMRRLAPTVDEVADEVAAVLRGGGQSAAEVTDQLVRLGFSAGTAAAVVKKLGLSGCGVAG
jgi:hypothetical protein